MVFSRVDQVGWVDVYRRLHPEATGEAYTGGRIVAGAGQRNVGWRIDHQIATPGVAEKALRATVYKEQRLRPRPADHRLRLENLITRN